MHIIKNVILLDQLTKLAALSVLKGHFILIPGFISFKLTHNTGVSLGIFSGLPGYYLIALQATIASLIVGFITYYFARKDRFILLHKLSLQLIIGGAVSNLLDRFMFGGVIDFISMSFFGIDMFICNVADIFLTVGGILFAMTYKNGIRVNSPKFKDILVKEDSL